jgi:hypothetical protein
MKTSVLVSAMMLIFFTTSAQNPGPAEPSYNSKKGFGIYAIVQPMWFKQTALNQRLTAANLPQLSKFNWQMGLGISYLFKTGTELGLDVTSSSKTNTSDQFHITTTPIAYDFVVRQNILSIVQGLQLYAMAGGGGFEQNMSIERPTPIVNQFQQALLTNNVARFTQATEGIVFGLGLKIIDSEQKKTQLTDYAAFELGYRIQYGKTWWYNNFYDLNNGPEADLRQFYISFKWGGFIKGKNKPKKGR